MSIRQHQIELLAKEPAAKDNVVPAKVVRQVFLGSSRDYMVEVADGTQLRIVTSAGESAAPGARCGCICRPSAAGRWPDKPNTADRRIPGRKRRCCGRYPGETCSRLRRAGVDRSCRVGSGRARRRRAAITPELIEAAKKEGKVVWYTSIDLPAAERIAKSFEAKYPGIPVRVERSGAERVFQRIGQEYASRIYAVDVVNTSDAAHVIVWKPMAGWRPTCPRTWRKHFPPSTKIRTECSRASASRFARSPTTPTW